METAVTYNPRTKFHMHIVQSPARQVTERRDSNVLLESMDRFKRAIFRCVENEHKKQGSALRQHALAVAEALDDVSNACHQVLGPVSSLTDIEKENLGAQVRCEMVPYLLMANIPFRFYTKPRGYAGDFLTIHNMYQNTPQGVNETGKILDRLFLDNPCTRAVQNRRSLLAGYISETIRANQGRPSHITSFACGPARELFDIDDEIGPEQLVFANLIDIDLQALAHISTRIETTRPRIRMRLHQENLIHLAIGRRQLKLSDQDLVYSIGLIDYFEDELVIRLINYAHTLLRRGGKLILGNFHRDNPVREFMDHVLEWKLIHRTEEDMNRLFEASSFGKPCTEFKFEEQGINMFAVAVK